MDCLVFHWKDAPGPLACKLCLDARKAGKAIHRKRGAPAMDLGKFLGFPVGFSIESNGIRTFGPVISVGIEDGIRGFLLLRCGFGWIWP